MTDPNDPNAAPPPAVPTPAAAPSELASAPDALAEANSAVPALLGWPPNLPQMFTKITNQDLVIATLESEMARLEQSVTRSGWTSWAGTAALGGIAWIFVTLLDAPIFPWHSFIIITTLLSFVQDFVYSVDYAMRPRRGIGLLVGDQKRVMLSKETLPFARKQYCFYLVRATLLATASYLYLPTLAGWAWWLPFTAYTLVAVTMVISFVLSAIDRPVPKHDKFNIGELIGQALILYIAVTSLMVLVESWQPGDFIALKAALLAIAASHVLRGLAEPQFELPALDKLRELRRSLGFGQVTPAEAIVQAEAALFGLPSFLIIATEITAFTTALEQLGSQLQQLANRVATLRSHVQALNDRPELKSDDIRIGEALFRDALAAQRAVFPRATRFTEAEQALVERVNHYKQSTQNDASIPIVEKLLVAQKTNFAHAILRMMMESKLLIHHARTLEKIAARHSLPIVPELHAATDAMEGHLARQVAKLQQTATEAQTASQEKP